MSVSRHIYKHLNTYLTKKKKEGLSYVRADILNMLNISCCVRVLIIIPYLDFDVGTEYWSSNVWLGHGFDMIHYDNGTIKIRKHVILALVAVTLSLCSISLFTTSYSSLYWSTLVFQFFLSWLSSVLWDDYVTLFKDVWCLHQRAAGSIAVMHTLFV